LRCPVGEAVARGRPATGALHEITVSSLTSLCQESHRWLLRLYPDTGTRPLGALASRRHSSEWAEGPAFLGGGPSACGTALWLGLLGGQHDLPFSRVLTSLQISADGPHVIGEPPRVGVAHRSNLRYDLVFPLVHLMP